MQHALEYHNNCDVSNSKQVDALDLQGVSRAGSGVSKMNSEIRDHATEARHGQTVSPASIPIETTSLSMKPTDASRPEAQQKGSEEDAIASQEVAPSQEVKADTRPPEFTQDAASVTKKSHSHSKVNSKGVLAGGKRKKKGRAGTQRGAQQREPPPTDAGESQSLVLKQL